MSRVDDLFERYRSAFREGADPDPRPYLEQVEAADRRELDALIQGFLATLPPREFDPEKDAGSPAGELTRRVLAAARAERAETWPALLPQARQDVQLLREELVRRLADDLGAPDKVEKVARYYNAMEHGRLPVQGVADRVLEALSGVIGVSVARLRAAGERSLPLAGGEGFVFARTASPSPFPPPDVLPGIPPLAGEDWDEVDELFQGGM